MLTELKAGLRVVGAKQTRRALADGRAVRVFLAEDADDIELLNQSEPDFANFETIDIALALNKIDLKYREPIIMKYFNDYSTEEISIRLGISQNLVLQRIFRGKKLLHKLLTER